VDACCDTHRTYMPQHARSFVPFVPAISLLPNGPYACSLHYRGIWRRFFGASGWRSVRAGWLRRRPAPFAEHSILRGARSPLGWPQGPRLRFHQIDSAVHCVSQFLLAAEIALGGVDRDMPEQKLNLLQFSAGEVTHGRDQADFGCRSGQASSDPVSGYLPDGRLIHPELDPPAHAKPVNYPASSARSVQGFRDLDESLAGNAGVRAGLDGSWPAPLG